jgi:putative addiction module component (TIGR02574 family)
LVLVSGAIQDLKRLPLSERIQLVEDLWDSIAEDSPAMGLTPEHIAELDRRLDALEAQPNAGTPWEIARERILASL